MNILGMYPIASLPPSLSSWEQLDGKIIYSLNNKLYVDIQLDLGYSRIKIEEQEEVANILNSFQGTNLLNVAMIYTENPNDSLDPTKIFGSGYVDMSCKPCGDILPRLIIKDTDNNKFIYTDRIYKADELCPNSNQLSTKQDSLWYEAPVIYNTITAPQKSVTISEIYFDTPDGTKLKFAGFKC